MLPVLKLTVEPPDEKQHLSPAGGSLRSGPRGAAGRALRSTATGGSRPGPRRHVHMCLTQSFRPGTTVCFVRSPVETACLVNYEIQ